MALFPRSLLFRLWSASIRTMVCIRLMLRLLGSFGSSTSVPTRQRWREYPVRKGMARSIVSNSQRMGWVALAFQRPKCSPEGLDTPSFHQVDCFLWDQKADVIFEIFWHNLLPFCSKFNSLYVFKIWRLKGCRPSKILNF